MENGPDLKPPYCIELENFERVTDTLVRFSVESKFNLKYATLKLECSESK